VFCWLTLKRKVESRAKEDHRSILEAAAENRKEAVVGMAMEPLVVGDDGNPEQCSLNKLGMIPGNFYLGYIDLMEVPHLFRALANKVSLILVCSNRMFLVAA